MKDHLAYLRYVLRHKWYVLLAGRVTGASFWRCLVHDASKFLPSEWNPYRRTFYAPDGTSRYQPTGDFDLAWNAHQHRNKHHWQHWVLKKDDGTLRALPMPDRYVREMVADWLGAGAAIRMTGDKPARHPGTVGWFNENRNNMLLHVETERKVTRLLEWVSTLETEAEQGRKFFHRNHWFPGFMKAQLQRVEGTG